MVGAAVTKRRSASTWFPRLTHCNAFHGVRQQSRPLLTRIEGMYIQASLQRTLTVACNIALADARRETFLLGVVVSVKLLGA